MASQSAIAIAELRAQAVAKEIERKQNLMRLKWFEQNYEKVYQNPSLPKEKVPKKAAVLYEELKKMRKERYEKDRELKGKEKPILFECEETKIEDLSFEPMYPVPQDVKATLYDGVSHDEEGRYRYLKLRNREDPHDKFRSKETSGFEYGWRVRERCQPPEKRFCRRTTWHMRKNGALRQDDPARRPPTPAGHIGFPFL